ncbi:Peptidyl-prolyl cis-trans isomerase FKBP4 [Araneus ventricosus]|uniref:peptidylprolyl isomerase n=1 Tax=Araneus ventricosus TaxID=182803 RepID=A0A4Y2RL92_ARAVE|nr:Peptidyl-prolyl cis-trans isomerase FKBP4 [Araneus ventricosus]
MGLISGEQGVHSADDIMSGKCALPFLCLFGLVSWCGVLLKRPVYIAEVLYGPWKCFAACANSAPDHDRLWMLATFNNCQGAWSVYRPGPIILGVMSLLDGKELLISEKGSLPALICGLSQKFSVFLEPHENNKFELALKQYQKILSYLQYESEAEGENKTRKDNLVCAGHLNVAACYLKMEKFGDVIEHSEKALEIQPKNPKGHFRRGKAYISLQEFEKAKENFMRVLEYDPSNSAAKKIITVCNANLKKQLEKEKKMYQNIFRKMAEERENVC